MNMKLRLHLESFPSTHGISGLEEIVVHRHKTREWICRERRWDYKQVIHPDASQYCHDSNFKFNFNKLSIITQNDETLVCFLSQRSFIEIFVKRAHSGHIWETELSIFQFSKYLSFVGRFWKADKTKSSRTASKRTLWPHLRIFKIFF